MTSFLSSPDLITVNSSFELATSTTCFFNIPSILLNTYVSSSDFIKADVGIFDKVSITSTDA